MLRHIFRPSFGQESATTEVTKVTRFSTNRDTSEAFLGQWTTSDISPPQNCTSMEYRQVGWIRISARLNNCSRRRRLGCRRWRQFGTNSAPIISGLRSTADFTWAASSAFMKVIKNDRIPWRFKERCQNFAPRWNAKCAQTCIDGFRSWPGIRSRFLAFRLRADRQKSHTCALETGIPNKGIVSIRVPHSSSHLEMINLVGPVKIAANMIL